MDRIHDEEVDTSEPILRSLLADQCPRWLDWPARRIDATGTSNTLWRLMSPAGAGDVVVRLPRQPGTDRSVRAEIDLLPALARTGLIDQVALPELRHAGTPTDAYPMAWMACGWLEGRDLWSTRSEAATDPTLAVALADAVHTIRRVTDLPLERRALGQRGGPFTGVVARLRGWLDDPRWNADRLVDVDTIRRLADAADELVDPSPTGVVTHGDLIPGNLLVDPTGRLTAIIDWGGCGIGDPAEDLAPAWAVFDRDARAVFREAMRVDDATWHRGRITELEHAVGGVLYYRPRGHPLGDVMAATLGRILEDA